MRQFRDTCCHLLGVSYSEPIAFDSADAGHFFEGGVDQTPTLFDLVECGAEKSATVVMPV